VIVERDLESGWLVGIVAGLPGCYTQAPDMTTLEENVREAIQAYFGDGRVLVSREGARARGREGFVVGALALGIWVSPHRAGRTRAKGRG
jgi:predicted RNase H-like HicB family nuclease